MYVEILLAYNPLSDPKPIQNPKSAGRYYLGLLTRMEATGVIQWDTSIVKQFVGALHLTPVIPERQVHGEDLQWKEQLLQQTNIVQAVNQALLWLEHFWRAPPNVHPRLKVTD